LQEKILKFCFDNWRFTHQIVGFFAQKPYGYDKFDIYRPQTVKNTISELYHFDYLIRRKFSRYFKYITSEKGRKYILGVVEIVDEVYRRSSKDSGQMIISVFTR